MGRAVTVRAIAGGFVLPGRHEDADHKNAGETRIARPHCVRLNH